MIAQRENECVSLSVVSVGRVMIAQWENQYISLSVLSAARVQFSAMAESFRGFFSWLMMYSYNLPMIHPGLTIATPWAPVLDHDSPPLRVWASPSKGSNPTSEWIVDSVLNLQIWRIESCSRLEIFHWSLTRVKTNLSPYTYTEPDQVTINNSLWVTKHLSHTHQSF